MKRLLLFLFIPIQFISAQNKITLDQCYELAKENYPNLKKEKIWREISSIKKENINTSYLPQVNLSGQVTYQSDVPGIDLSIPGITIPKVSKDQYKVFAELKQTIWDGGISEIHNQLEEAVLNNNLNELQIELYKLNEKVSQAFFTGLVMKKQIQVLEEQRKILEEKLRLIESKVKNGVAEKTSVSVIKAELLNLEQKELQLKAGQNAALHILSILTGENISSSREMFHPDKSPLFNATFNRPDLDLLKSKNVLLTKQIDLLDKSRNPKVFGFGQAGYGKPGLNMLSDSFDAYYLIGVGVSWKIFDWKNTTRQKQIIKLRQETIAHQKATITQNLEILLTQQKEQIIKLEKMLQNDEKMVMLRADISKSAESKLENETITTALYIQDIQAETIARLNTELHKIQLAMAIEKFNTIKGN